MQQWAMPICKWCNEDKDESAFYMRTPGHPRPECRACTLAVKKERWDNPDWQPKCYRCKAQIERSGEGGKRLCRACLGQKYDLAAGRRSTGRRPLKLKPCSLCGAERDQCKERSPLCEECSSFGKAGARLMSRFGITPQEYRAMLAAQGGVCFICRKPPKKGRILGVDHDHKTGRVRGLLHAEMGSCNTRLGWFNDNAEWFRRAHLYLTEPPAVAVIGERIVPEMIGIGMAQAAKWSRDSPTLG